MPEVFTLEVTDEFSYELAPANVPPTRRALAKVADLAIAQDASCEYVVTLSGDRLTLWNPEVHMADQATRRFQGSLEDAVGKAAAWLAAYLALEPDEITPLLDPAAFR